MRYQCYSIVAMLAVVLVVGCDRQPQAWEDASTDDTVAAYDAYLEDYPDGEHAAEARARRDMLAESQAWNKAQSADTPEAYETYLENHASGPHAAEARERLAKVESESDWEQARQANTPDAYAEYARKHPDSPKAAEARMLGSISEGRPQDLRNMSKVRARIVSMDGGEIVVRTQDSVRLGSLTVPPREMSFNADSSAVEGSPKPKVGDTVTLYLSERPGEDGEPQVVGVLATQRALAESESARKDRKKDAEAD
ncbi:hypothetical protein BH24PSE2_BH24PSE2_04290 [soil metagenome]